MLVTLQQVQSRSFPRAPHLPLLQHHLQLLALLLSLRLLLQKLLQLRLAH